MVLRSALPLSVIGAVRSVEKEPRLEVARTAVEAVLADWLRHGGQQYEVQVWLDADDEVCVWVDGGGTTPSAGGDTPVELAASVADHLHAELMEQAHRVLPLCPDHECGLHPTATDHGPAWRCAVGRHIVGHVGTLTRPDADRDRRGPS